MIRAHRVTGNEGKRVDGKSVGFTVPTLQSRNWRVAILLQTKSAVLFSVVVEPRKTATNKKRLSGQARGAKENRGVRRAQGGKEATRAA